MSDNTKVGNVPIDVFDMSGIMRLPMLHAATCTFDKGPNAGETFEVSTTMSLGGMALIVNVLGKQYTADLAQLVRGIIEIHEEAE